MPAIQKIRCQVEQLIDHGEQVYSVVLRLEKRGPLFRPGQFLHLALDPYEPGGFWPESRVFSIASSPAQRERLRISYSVRGRFTARMEKELRVGQSVWVKLPYGDFVIEPQRPLLLCAGGTGITAFTAFLESLPPEGQYPVYLAYGARSHALLIYRDLIEKCAQQAPQLQPFYFVEAAPALAGEIQGRLSVDPLWPQIAQPAGILSYLSGPPAMVATLTQDLRRHGLPPEAIRTDAWE